MKATQVRQPDVIWQKRECYICGKKTAFPYANYSAQYCFCTRACYDKYTQKFHEHLAKEDK